MLEERIRHAYHESVTGIRRGDTLEEMEAIRAYIINAEKIIVPNHSQEKVTAINKVLTTFGLKSAYLLQVHTDSCDLSRMPALTKAEMALDISDADLVIARGRLGVPGSGSMLVIMDRKRRILSASLSPPHVLHGKSVKEAVCDEIRDALVRIGFAQVKHED